jgi:hypothetical protein
MMPSKDTCRLIADALVRQAGEFDSMLKSLQPQLSPDEFDAARTIVGRVLGEIYVVGLYPIFEAYPELKPAACR